jgi:putative Ca2+/H+ antiporter (TMEM165/GDT1 family)
MIVSTVLTSASVVALAEVGDKTMLLAILLVSRMRKPWAILAGIFCATVVNHLLAAFVGSEVSGLLDAKWFRILVSLGFIAMAAWTLVPDKIDDDDTAAVRSHGGAFLTTVIAFFLVEIGDKTQIATIALAAHYHSVLDVAIGTTLGMMIADGPAVFLGEALVRRISLRGARIGAALLFLILGLWQLAAVLSGN